MLRWVLFIIAFYVAAAVAVKIAQRTYFSRRILKESVQIDDFGLDRGNAEMATADLSNPRTFLTAMHLFHDD